MARLLIKTEGIENPVLELHLGVNRVGRSDENHFQIDHPTISTTHCELVLGDGTVTLRDCGSTNGTFVDGRRVTEAPLEAGQMVRLGDVELFVETVDVNIAIPRIEHERPAPPVMLPDGAVACARHAQSRVTHQCTQCRELMCEACVHKMRRHGGKTRLFCPLCSKPVVALGAKKPKKKTFLSIFKQTVKVPFLRLKHHEESEEA